MAVKSFKQLGFADHLVRQRKTRHHRALEQIDASLDWNPIADLLAPVRKAGTSGRQGFPPLLMFKCLLLAQWHTLSDPSLEYAISDRLSFRRFVGLPLDETAPDETSFVRFRASLRAHKLEARVFEAILAQMDALGLVLRQGTLMDATIVQAAVKPPSIEEGQVSKADCDAEFTKKNNKSYFGYKLHIGLDQGSNLIRRLLTSGASLHDSMASRDLISGDEGAVYADKAYGSKELRDELEATNIKDQIMYKAARNKPLTPWQKWFNKAVSSIRSMVEAPFGIGKTCNGLARTRYRGLPAVTTSHYLFAISYNLKIAFGK